jgi:ankyrin repeat protein
MKDAGLQALVTAVGGQDEAGLGAALDRLRGPIPARAIVEAGRLAWQTGLALLAGRGGDLNASHRNYRALHALMQEKPHAGGSSTPKRVRCLSWLLEHGADPELLGAWPSARAIVIAAFVGEREYVRALVQGGARMDLFAAAALGEARQVARVLRASPEAAASRDGDVLTALHACAGSRLGSTSPKVAAGLLQSARLLVEAGADVNATARSWGHDVNVAYFVIRAGQIELLKLLLDHGLDTTAAVGTAAWENREEIVDLLLNHGARIDAAFESTRPVLNELIRWGQFAPARMLLRKGASPNLADDRGWTAIHQAVSRGNVKMLASLMQSGGDADRPDRRGITPRDLARARRRVDLERILGA